MSTFSMRFVGGPKDGEIVENAVCPRRGIMECDGTNGVYVMLSYDIQKDVAIMTFKPVGKTER